MNETLLRKLYFNCAQRCIAGTAWEFEKEFAKEILKHVEFMLEVENVDDHVIARIKEEFGLK